MASDQASAEGRALGAAKVLLGAAARGLALFLGAFGLLNTVATLRNPGLDLNLWWVDLRPLAPWLAQSSLGLVALCLLGYGLGARWHWLRVLAPAATFGLLAAAVRNTAIYSHLLASGAIYSGPPVPFSLFVAASLTVVFLGVVFVWGLRLPRVGRGAMVVVFLTALAIFPGAQISRFGSTDYRRPADVIVVFGAQTLAGNRPSVALADRVRTACSLYQEGYAPRLIFSGGPGPGTAHEAEAMRLYAHELGVPDAAILLDLHGLSTRDTVRNTVPMFQDLDAHRVLAVSHAFHLPRIKLSYQRAGWEVFTAPTQDPRMLPRQYPFMYLRETAAFWVYYLRGV